MNHSCVILVFPERDEFTEGRGGYPARGRVLVLFAVSLCPLPLIKHPEHGRRQITAADTGVLLRSSLPESPQGSPAELYRVRNDVGPVTASPTLIHTPKIGRAHV